MSLSAFLAQNAIKVENEKIVVSQRFVNQAGEPMEWEIRAMTEEENKALRRSCTKSVKLNKVARTTETDSELYIAKMVAESVVYPDLKNAQLQESYKAYGAEELLQKMLTAGEYSTLLEAVHSLNGFDKEDELEEEAKN